LPLSGVEKLTDGPVGQGSRFRGEFKGMGTVTWGPVEYRVPERVVNGGLAKSFRFTSTLAPTPTEGGTHVAAKLQVEPLGLYRLMTPLR
jgi:hypothetical protein